MNTLFENVMAHFDREFVPLTVRKPTAEEHYAAAMTETMLGKGDFWPADEWEAKHATPKWDAEQNVVIFNSVHNAMSALGLSDAQRWNLVVAAARKEAEHYANHKAGWK